MYWLNENSRLFLSRGYLEEGVKAEDRIMQIAQSAAKYLDDESFAERFYDYMGRGFYSLSSPVWSNFGNSRGLPISCYGSHISDNMSSILKTQAEVGMMSKYGGGTSGYFGDLRPRGAEITGNGHSSGAVHFMKLFETIIDVISQGSTRRGRFAPYLPIEHPDVMEFLNIGSEGDPIQELTHGVTVTDAWMEDMIAGDRDKRKIWAKVLQSRSEIGYPYIFFTDNVNNNTVDVYKGKHKITHSNLCVSGDTRILTNKGQIEIKHLAGSQVKVWNGEEYSNVLVQKTGENQKLVRVITSGGQELEVTPYHKFYIAKTDKSGKMIYPASYKEVRAEELKADDKLIKFNLPIIKGEIELENAYDNGFFSGDGTHEPTGRYKLYLYNEKKDLAEFFNSVDKWYDQSEFGRLYGYPKNMKPKFFVPGGSYTVESRVKWLAGYLDADGTVAVNGTNQSLQAASINKEFLLDVQLMLQTLGVTSKVTLNKKAGKTMLPKNDGSGEYGEYDTKEIYRILISSSSLYKLHELGLKTNRLDWTPRKPQRNAEQFIKVLSVEEVEGEHDTFCFNEPKRHMGMFNGLLTGQCSEIMLPNNDRWSFVCNLSSMNLAKYDEWKDTDAVETMIYFLEAVMEDYIVKLEKLRDSKDIEERDAFKYMEKAYTFAIENRALGLGVNILHP